MRLLLDTNVLIAAFVARGACSELFEHCARSHALVTSTALLAELETTLRRKFGATVRDAHAVVALLQRKVDLIDPRPLDRPVCRDPDDDKVLAAALSGRCNCIITGDKDLLVLESFKGIPIVTPMMFWKVEAAAPGDD
ncbi:MAG: putative toxin-antitoxin system toxin component, PIN family [Betaproteobacteria bacterium]